jgi:hypothetical protein
MLLHVDVWVCVGFLHHIRSVVDYDNITSNRINIEVGL